MKMLFAAYRCLLTSIAFCGWMLGYVMAHNEVSRECDLLGGFYVGPKTYTCQIKGGQHE
jgi:hypothetical protein